MNKIIFILFMVVNLFGQTYTVNKNESNINFSATKFMFVGVDGSFSEFQGEIVIDNNKLVSISGIVYIESIFTDNDERDTHLKANDYFDIDTYPKIKISTLSVKSNILIAKIAIKGIEKDIQFNIDNFAILGDKVELSLSSTIDRQQFMLNGSMSAIMSDNVDVLVKLIANIK